MEGEWWEEAHQDESCPTSATSNVEHHVVDALTTMPLLSVPEMVSTAESTTFTNGIGKISWLSSGNNASSKQGEEVKGEKQDEKQELSSTIDLCQSSSCKQQGVLSPSCADYSQQSKRNGQREETKHEVLPVRSICVNAGGHHNKAVVRAKDDPFGRAITRWRHSHTANDTKPFPLKGQDRKAEQWLAVRRRSRAAAAAERR